MIGDGSDPPPSDDSEVFAFGIGRKPPIAETHPHLKHFMAFLDEFNKETPRGAALAAAAFLDDLLGRTISAFLITNDSGVALTDGFNAPLGTLAAKIAACHAMGLISEVEYKECDLVRKIRNEFAHKVHMSFKDDRVRSLCASLTMNAKSYPGVTVDTREKFTTAAVSLVLNLTNRPHYVAKNELKYGNWPT
jgi:mannitol operon repressor